jgi:Ferritin-like domain
MAIPQAGGPFVSQLITLEALDQDGALRETAEAAGATRADFLKRGGVAGAGFLAGGVLFSGFVSPAEAAISTSRRSKKNDVRIANYALTLEYLESEFYKQANASGALTQPEVKVFASITGQHEAAHVKALKALLGSAAVKKPRFDFGDTVTNEDKFKQTAQVLEDTGVAAYAGQGPNLLQRPIVKAALSIHSVEARHAAWIRFINSSGGLRNGTVGNYPAPRAFDKALSEKAVLKAVTGTGFIQ